ncbi:flavodoxin [Victivallis sp. Marseille-Q1083]|uniref:flavodoxin n=1 Tax=Victivallis sp. Marseille-Q1083 TaxID=2717288 RepID=UPI001C37C68F|nr:flavodoxin [Victivallis sp. Marseille-Q1083]
MIRKAMVYMMAGAMFSMFGCSAAEPAPAAKVTAEPGKILVAYYSYSGNTRFAAERIQQATGGKLFEIKPVTPYPADYDACVDQVKKEISDGFRPELAEKVKEFDQYEVIFVGTPNWWSTMAPPVLTFLASYDFSDKTVIPFVTHGGGGMARCESDMRQAIPKANFGKGGAFSGRNIKDSEAALAEWLDEVITVKK